MIKFFIFNRTIKRDSSVEKKKNEMKLAFNSTFLLLSRLLLNLLSIVQLLSAFIAFYYYN